ncbi:CPBP family intramembrane glutamic endopeptidase [Sporosarcina highlanderae]|uniref:CPBP family intramembrane metalloprotease n=1 Tax=Sporosarcina highlanderae TaxID=3035916 RepID=A0ABT8JV77_9BACL|nr:CPBP family intramembrane glutamic endopeptidase [Sporosarcina highlanderae]MDN4608084.1 CPBP family intramembrane metalloprotease [Sporosarcina highlanderae]
MAFSRFLFRFVLSFLFIGVYTLVDIFFQLGLTSDDANNIFTLPFLYFITLLILLPRMRKKFVLWFIFKKEETYKTICYPILVAIIQSFLVYIYMYTPYWLGSEAIGIGSKQVTTVEGVTEIGLTIGATIIGPFNEEFIFRFFLIAGFIEILNFSISKFKRLIKLKPIAIIFWIIVTNSFFSLLHGPDLLSFPPYFVGGVIPSLFFIRYGFLAAWISHGMFNFLSPIAFSIIHSLFM